MIISMPLKSMLMHGFWPVVVEQTIKKGKGKGKERKVKRRRKERERKGKRKGKKEEEKEGLSSLYP
jgi:hypothetical protein